jgi:spore cortex formation protein SpoVR/YcgB (stage V sporulation)
MTMNPYLVGSEMWKSIKERWDKGRHGSEWDNCTNYLEKENWDTKEMKGWEKCLDVMRSYTDWFFMQDFLTAKLVNDCDLYIYQKVEGPAVIEFIRTEHTAEQVRDIIVASFAHSGIPKIDVVDGNYSQRGVLELRHRYAGVPLDKEYTKRTLSHVNWVWGNPVILHTSTESENLTYQNSGGETLIEHFQGEKPQEGEGDPSKL